MDKGIILGGLSILIGGLAVLVPVIGITLRLAVKPFFDTWAEIQRARLSAQRNDLLERRIELLETELQQMQDVLGPLAEAQDFQRQLANPAPDVLRASLESGPRA